MAKFVIQPHSRLQEWVAEELGFFAEEGLDHEFQAQGFASSSVTTSAVRSADSDLLGSLRSQDRASAPGQPPVELRRGAFEDMSAVRACDVSAACHWAVSAAATSGAGRMWGGAYSVTPCGVFVAPDSPYRSPEDLDGVEVAVGYHSGSHYATVQALEAFLPVERISLSFQGLPNDRVRRLIRGEVAAATVFGAQYYVVEQLGYRKLADATFAVGFLVSATADPEDTAKYFRALEKAQRAIDLRPEAYLRHWARELPEDIAELVDVRRFGPGERIVLSPYTKEMFDATQRWMSAHGLLNVDAAATGPALTGP